jgi:hypothetical protein
MTYRTGYRGGAALFSLPFIGVGVWISLVGFETLPPPGRVNAPLSVVALIGTAFALAGLMLLGHAVRGMRHHARREQVVELYPDRPWLSDFPWDERGIASRLGARALQDVFGATLWCVFLAPFHWWAFLSGAGHVMLWLIVGLFEFVSVFVVWNAVRRVLCWAKYGRAHLRFRRFPFEPGGTLSVVFSPNFFHRFVATLRFVEERIEQTGRGRNRSSRIVHEALHEQVKELEPGPLQPEVDIEFELPADETLVTSVSGTPVRYWELQIEAEDPGVDFDASWPLPVYAGTRKAIAARGGTVTVTD